MTENISFKLNLFVGLHFYGTEVWMKTIEFNDQNSVINIIILIMVIKNASIATK